ncbi:4520_t:CDS:2 [Diversispora eburnea]|uniref:4520_t:CDS:1 n=1 Tax=Diversispora eburnea TaxID=1213867 RepID=A0A9N9BN10_9GLOM|nr:4520_t:CDS:2 [Diversispora eburnea]
MLLLFIHGIYVYTKNLFSCFFPFNFTLKISEIELEKNVHSAAQVILENRIHELQQENQNKQAKQAILENRIHELQQENQKIHDEKALENKIATNADANLKLTVAKMIEEIKENCKGSLEITNIKKIVVYHLPSIGAAATEGPRPTIRTEIVCAHWAELQKAMQTLLELKECTPRKADSDRTNNGSEAGSPSQKRDRITWWYIKRAHKQYCDYCDLW